MTTPRVQLPPLPPGIRLLHTNESQALNERLPMAAVTVKDCITCHGKKTFIWKDAAGARAEFDCSCEDQYVLHRYLLNSGVMLSYQKLDWGDFVHMSDDTAAAALDYFDNRQRYIDAGIGLILSGTRGTGKSLLAYLLLKQMIGEGIDCYATTFSDMIDNFAGGWQDRAQGRWFNATVRNAGILLIDDLGRERNKGPASVGENMLETVVRHRVGCQQPTIITTNLETEEIMAGYGGHVMSLLSERSIIVEINGRDVREDMRQRTLDEVFAGLTRPIVVV